MLWSHVPRPRGRDLAEHRPAGGTEAGTGLVSTTAAVLAFLCFLLFSVQVVVGLYASSTVGAVTYDAARSVASGTVDHHDPIQVERAQDRAERQARALLGGIGRDATFTWLVDEDSVHLAVSVRAPGILPTSISSFGGPKRIERRAVVRIEEQR